jgi:hypothetical protein
MNGLENADMRDILKVLVEATLHPDPFRKAPGQERLAPFIIKYGDMLKLIQGHCRIRLFLLCFPMAVHKLAATSID